jgi:hypothetical protein
MHLQDSPAPPPPFDESHVEHAIAIDKHATVASSVRMTQR